MDRRRVFRDLTQSLSSGFFSDKVVIILARIKNTKQIEPSDIEILSGVEEFFDNVLAGYRWSEKPSFSENSLKYASSFSQAVEAISSACSASSFKVYVQELKDISSKIKNREIDETGLGKLTDFFYSYSLSELHKTDQILTGAPAGFPLP